jgi:crossover junction endodeoxyribonuclease RusA
MTAKRVSFTVPLVPPGVNNYVKHTRSGRHYVTDNARAFKDAVIILARGKSVIGRAFQVEAVVYLGHKQKGDVDNFGKLILDALADAGVFQKANLRRPLVTPTQLSDAHVSDLILRRRRDVDNPRTEITIEAHQ